VKESLGSIGAGPSGKGIIILEILGSKAAQPGVQFLQMTQFGMQGWVKGI
jgi:hypothetical protein